MATSVSRINVTVGANTQQLTTGMQQAAASVQGFSGASANAQFAIQQLVFAADDAIVSFGTGGFAGAVRGAQNNVTAFAASLFGVKGLMVAVAASAVAQLAVAFTKVKSDADTASEAVDRLSQNLDKLEREQRRRRGVQEAAAVPVDNAATERRTAQQRIQDIQEEIDVRRKALADQGLTVATALEELAIIDRETLKPTGEIEFVQPEEIRKQAREILELEKDIKSLNNEIKALNKTEERFRDLQRAFTAPGQPNIAQRFELLDSSKTLGAVAETIQAKLKVGKDTFDPFRFFGALPGANAFGSSGAVSAINQAQIGPKNVQDAQLKELQAISKSNGAIERKLGNKLHSLVEVPL